MIKYILALIILVSMYRIETTDSLKPMWGVFGSLMVYAILILRGEV